MLVRLAPFGFVLLWSSSFVAAKAGLQHLSPLLFVAIQLAACAIMVLLLMLILRRSWRPLAFVGVLVLVAGTRIRPLPPSSGIP